MSPAIPQFVERNAASGVSRATRCPGFLGSSHSWTVETPARPLVSCQSHKSSSEHRHRHRHQPRNHINVNVYDRRRGLAGYPFGTVLTLRADASGREFGVGSLELCKMRIARICTLEEISIRCGSVSSKRSALLNSIYDAFQGILNDMCEIVG